MHLDSVYSNVPQFIFTSPHHHHGNSNITLLVNNQSHSTYLNLENLC